jgi:transketolase C-terminal domain/subunit
MPPFKHEKGLSTREAYGHALKRLVEADQHHQVVVLDADVKNSTFSMEVFKSQP